MTTKYTKYFNTKETPQSQKIPGSNQVKNNAGGFSFQANKWDKLNRFLVLGSEGGTYYVGEQKLTIDNAENVIACIKEDGVRVVNTIVEISDAGRAPKNDPAIFVLALVAANGDEKAKIASYAAINKVCRIGTHLFNFCDSIQGLRGWSRGLRNGVGKFYTNMNVDKVAYQMIKYRQRNGWTHQDVLRLSHPKATNAEMNDLFKYAVGKGKSENAMINAFEKAQSLDVTSNEVIGLIKEYNLPREAIPTQLLNNVNVWAALLERMPLTALIRNLGKMTNIGLLSDNLSDATVLVTKKLTDKDYIKRSRVHPLSILNALKTYSSGRGVKGSLSWNPVSGIIDALNDAFYLAFDNVEATGKRIMLALDVSGSMGMSWNGGIAGMNISPREGSCAMALVTAAVEPHHEIVAFSHQMVPVNISKRQRLDDVVRYTSRIPMGGTDCALPMLYAMEKGMKVDTFIVYTDNETWCGRIHPVQALKQYRQKTGIPAKLVVVGMSANDLTIADPDDMGMLDVVGFDSATPNVISEFIKG